MKKVLLSALLLITFSAGMAAQVTTGVTGVDVQPQLQKTIEPAFNVAELLGLTENKVSDEMIHQIAWSGIPNRPHFIFNSLAQCQSIPECVCEPYNGLWGCFIR